MTRKVKIIRSEVTARRDFLANSERVTLDILTSVLGAGDNGVVALAPIGQEFMCHITNLR